MPLKKRKITPSQRSVFWPCGSCRRDCSHSSIYCNSCATWFHYACEGLGDFPSLDWSSIPTYTCLTCFSEEAAPPYSFSAALLRLTQVFNNMNKYNTIYEFIFVYLFYFFLFIYFKYLLFYLLLNLFLLFIFFINFYLFIYLLSIQFFYL